MKTIIVFLTILTLTSNFTHAACALKEEKQNIEKKQSAVAKITQDNDKLLAMFPMEIQNLIRAYYINPDDYRLTAGLPAHPSQLSLTNLINNHKRNAPYKLLSRGILLWGPSGTGKTHLIRTIKINLDVTHMSLQPAEKGPTVITSQWRKECSNVIIRSFNAMRHYALHDNHNLAIFFVENIDSMCGNHAPEASAIALSILLREMDRFENDDCCTILVIATTRLSASSEDGALLRSKFNHHINMDLPDQNQRQRLLNYFLDNSPYIYNPTLLHSKNRNILTKKIAAITEEATIADLENLIKEAKCKTAKSHAPSLTDDIIWDCTKRFNAQRFKGQRYNQRMNIIRTAEQESVISTLDTIHDNHPLYTLSLEQLARVKAMLATSNHTNLKEEHIEFFVRLPDEIQTALCITFNCASPEELVEKSRAIIAAEKVKVSKT